MELPLKQGVPDAAILAQAVLLRGSGGETCGRNADQSVIDSINETKQSQLQTSLTLGSSIAYRDVSCVSELVGLAQGGVAHPCEPSPSQIACIGR